MIEQNATQALRQLLGDRFTTSQSDREIHGRSESHFDLMPPAAVAYPTQQQMRCSASLKSVPVLAFRWSAGARAPRLRRRQGRMTAA